MNKYLRSAAEGRTPSVGDWHEHLTAFHRQYPDAMAFTTSLLRAPGNVSSYQHFAARLKALVPAADSILDVGCGDGTLLLALRESYGSGTRLAGIDLSRADLDRAKERLPHAELLCGDVATASYVANGFDLVVGHLSFALIPDVGRVFASIFRSLRKDGALAFVIEDPLSQSTIFRLIAAAMTPVRRRFPAFAARLPKREAWEDDAVLQALLRRAGFRADVHIERFALESRLAPEELLEVTRRSYVFGMLPRDLQAEAAESVLQAAGDVGVDGRSAASMSLRLVLAKC